VAGSLSAGAALVSILSYGRAHTGPSVEQVHRLAVTPLRDTVHAIGDSLQLAAVLTDDRGAALLGLAPSWTSADPQVAAVDQAGTVVSRGAGSTAIMVGVGSLETWAWLVVAQRAASLQLPDTLLRLAEGERTRPAAQALDARGQPIAGAAVRWESADVAVAALDSTGEVSGVSPGRSTLTATFDQLRAVLPLEVVPVPASLTIVGGEEQRAPAGQPLPSPVTAQIVSRSGRPVAGVAASFLVRGGIGAVAPEVDTSDARGMVQALWTLGPVPGRQQLALSVEGVGVSPVLTAEADPLSANTRVSLAGEPPAGTAGDSLPEPVTVRVADSAGTALSDLPVAWSAPDGGKVLPFAARTDSLGEARAHWLLGTRAGRQRLRVQVGNARLMPVFTVAATALPGVPVAVVVVGGDRQAAVAGKPLARPVALRVLDRHGNPVAGASLGIAISAGKVSDSLVSTDSAGQAKVRWTLGPAAGSQRLTVRLAGTKAAAEATAQARPGAPARLAFLAPPSSATAGRVLPKPLVVEVTDAHGNPVARRTVLFSTSSGTRSPARAQTESAGRAEVRWTPGGKSGSAALVAKVASTDVRGALTIPTRIRSRPAP
jgi:hypothetical protein